MDFYFLLKDHFTIDEISERAVKIFDQLFSPKLFRAQLSFFQDVNSVEPVDFLIPAPSEDDIKEFLIDKALDF